MIVDNQLSDHFSQALLEVFVTSNSSCSIKSILFEGSVVGRLIDRQPFSPEVMQQMKCIYGGKTRCARMCFSVVHVCLQNETFCRVFESETTLLDGYLSQQVVCSEVGSDVSSKVIP